MNFTEFADLVEAMRKHQKRYFASRNPDVLAEAKTLETRVDRAIQEVKKQPGLFDEQPT